MKHPYCTLSRDISVQQQIKTRFLTIMFQVSTHHALKRLRDKLQKTLHSACNTPDHAIQILKTLLRGKLQNKLHSVTTP